MRTVAILRRAIACLLLMLATTVASAQTELPEDPREVLKASISFGAGTDLMDNPLLRDRLNAEILLRARNDPRENRLCTELGDTAEVVTRIQSLVDAHLLLRHNGHIRPAFPLIIGAQRSNYLALIDATARRVERRLGDRLPALLEKLRARGWSEWEYHFVWSQWLDSQFVWADMLASHRSLPLSSARSWVLYPHQPMMSGTNFYPESDVKDYWLLVTWRSEASDTTGRIGGHWKALMDSALSGAPVAASDHADLADAGLLDQEGRAVIPMVRADDPLLRELRASADIYFAALVEELPATKLAHLLNVDPQFAWTISYHEVAFALLERWVRAGKIHLPAALQTGTHNSGLRGTAALVPVYPPFLKGLIGPN